MSQCADYATVLTFSASSSRHDACWPNVDRNGLSLWIAVIVWLRYIFKLAVLCYLQPTHSNNMGRESFFRFLCNQWLTVPELEKQDLSGQTILIVGANTGLGLEAAKHLARMDPGKLIVACRSLKKGEDAAKGMFSASYPIPWLMSARLYRIDIEKATGFGRTTGYAVDLSVFSSVNAFATSTSSSASITSVRPHTLLIFSSVY